MLQKGQEFSILNRRKMNKNTGVYTVNLVYKYQGLVYLDASRKVLGNSGHGSLVGVAL